MTPSSVRYFRHQSSLMTCCLCRSTSIRNATSNPQTYQPQKFLHPCNSFCILLQSSRYPRTRTSLFRETWLALPVPNKRFNVDLGLTTSPTEVSRFAAARLFAARYSRSSTTRLLLWRGLDAFSGDSLLLSLSTRLAPV